MIAQPRRLLHILFAGFSLLLLAIGCTPGSQAPATAQVTTPVASVSLDTLLATPSRYENMFLIVQGHSVAPMARPACLWVGPPTDWMLGSTLPDQHISAPLFLEVQNAFRGGLLPNLAMMHSPKQLELHGWLRQYNGPVGCKTFDAAGNTRFDAAPDKQIWYLETVQLEADVPIEWFNPHTPTPQVEYLPTLTPQP